nr:hypothetical protein [uncultured Haemophilus sp.]
MAGNLPPTQNAATDATTHQEAPKTTGEGNDVAKKDNAATVGDILNAGWNIQEKGTAKDFVKAYDVVNFEKGNGTDVSVTVSDESKTSTVKYSIKPADKSLVVDENGVKAQTSEGIETTENGIKAKAGNVVVVNSSGINVNTGKGLKIDSANGNKVAVDTDDSTITLDDNGKVKAVTGTIQSINTAENGKKKGIVQAKNGDENKLATVNSVAQAVNSAKWFAKADNKQTAITDAEKTTSDSGESMAAGDELTFTAGKNLRVKRSGKEFVFATVEKPEFTGLTLKEGENVVNVATTEKGLNLGKPKAGSNTETAPVNITGITSGLDQYDATTPKTAGLVNLNKTENNRPVVNNHTAATVGDLRNMGWVVSSDKTTDSLTTPYNAQVKNANEVEFVGTGIATVSDKTENGKHTITVHVEKAKVAQAPVVYTTTDGK